jgi:hypothetical protein
MVKVHGKIEDYPNYLTFTKAIIPKESDQVHNLAHTMKKV